MRPPTTSCSSKWLARHGSYRPPRRRTGDPAKSPVLPSPSSLASWPSAPCSAPPTRAATTLPDDRPLPAALPGQRGVLIGIAGHPVLLELFDHPMTLATQLPALLEGLLVDGIRQPWVPTTGRRARAFAHAASHRPLQAVQEAGIGVVAETRDTLVDIHGLLDHRNRLVHTAVVNVRHQLIAA